MDATLILIDSDAELLRARGAFLAALLAIDFFGEKLRKAK